MVNVEEGKKTIENVTYVPGLAANLLSVSKMAKKKLSLVFDENGCKIYPNSNIKVRDEVRITSCKWDT